MWCEPLAPSLHREHGLCHTQHPLERLYIGRPHPVCTPAWRTPSSMTVLSKTGLL